ncbi:MAG: hypothetical protein ACTSYA_02705 [Candidatus Kariarchaeaceae archaeon]
MDEIREERSYDNISLILDMIKYYREGRQDEKKLTLRYLAEQIEGVSYSQLSNYLNKRSVPKIEAYLRLKKFILDKLTLTGILEKNISYTYIGSRKIMGMPSVITNPLLLSIVTRLKISEIDLSEKKIDLVMTHGNEDGIILATILAGQLRKKLTYSSDEKRAFYDSFYQTEYITNLKEIRENMFIPKKMIPQGNRILITVDYIRTGRIVDALIELAEMANCEIVGIFSLVTINSEWESKHRLMNLKKENKMWSVYNLKM